CQLRVRLLRDLAVHDRRAASPEGYPGQHRQYVSGAGAQSLANHGAYGPNKEAIRGITRIAAREWGPFGITVNVISPYVASAESERYEREYPEVIAQIMKQIPLGRIGDAELNVGGLVKFLASPEGRYMTGSTFDVEGGAFLRP